MQLGRLVLVSSGAVLGVAKKQKEAFEAVTQEYAVASFEDTGGSYGLCHLVRLGDMAVIKVCNFGVFEAVVALPVPVPTACTMSASGFYQRYFADDFQAVDANYLTWLESSEGRNWGGSWLVTPLGGTEVTIRGTSGFEAVNFDVTAL